VVPGVVAPNPPVEGAPNALVVEVEPNADVVLPNPPVEPNADEVAGCEAAVPKALGAEPNAPAPVTFDATAGACKAATAVAAAGSVRFK
jgi:hypothetical protein